MGVKLQFVLGVVLVSIVCGAKDVPDIAPTSSSTPDNVALDKPEHHINLIEKSPKTEPEQKNVNTDTQNALTVDRLNKTEPLETSTRYNDDEKVETLSNNVVEKEPSDKTKENAIKKDLTDKSREDKSRSIETSHNKHPSQNYHRQNVYTPLTTDPEKYIDEIFNTKTTTHKFMDFDDFELTTPKSYYFDNKYKSAVDSIDQKLDDDDDMSSEEDPQMEKLPDADNSSTPSSNFVEFKELQGMKNNTFKDKNKVHKDMVVMQVKRVNINTSFYDSEDDDEDEDEDDDKEKYPRGENDKLETTSVKNNYILTTRKTVAFTKPPATNNSYILSNNIETETIKAINIATSEPPTSRPSRDDDKPSDEGVNKITTEKIQDNQIVPLQATPSTIVSAKISTTTIEHNLIPAVEEEKEETTTYSEESFMSTARTYEESRTIRIEENITPTSEEATSSEEVVEENNSSEHPTTNSIETTVVHTTDDTTKLSIETTTGFDRRNEPLIEEILTINDEATTSRERPTTINSQESTTDQLEDDRTSFDTEKTIVTTSLEKLVTTTNNYDQKEIRFETTTITKESGEMDQPKASQDDETTVMLRDEESTTETKIETTETGFRTSKSMNNENETSSAGSTDSKIYQSSFPVTEVTSTTTKPDTTTEIGPDTTRPVDLAADTITPTEHATSTSKTVETVTAEAAATTQVPTIVETTPEVLSTFIPREVMTTPETTSPPTTVTIITTTKEVHNVTIPPDEKTTESRENYPTIPYVSYTSRVDTTEASQVSTTEETITPAVRNLPGVPTDETKPSEEPIFITTTEDGAETASTEGVTGTPDDKKGTIAAIVISTVGAVCLILLAGLLYIMRKRQKRFNYGERCRPVSLDDYSVDNVSVYNSVRRKGNYRQSKRSYGNPAFDDPVAVSHPLNFPALAKFANNSEDIKAEFEEIPQIAARTSELPEGCETKNRYANVIPLPETRVCLKPIEGYPNSDYINANYVTGPKNVKGYYIATQAPMQNTVDDFWRMIWEQQSKVILMITHFFENGVEKCVDYLPPSEVLDCHRLFGDFQVTLKKRDVKEKYIISSLQLKNMVSNSWREVTHFWYMGWPEKGVPTEANSLIAFLIEARSYMKSSTLDRNEASNGDLRAAQNEINPVVVHCSPGTGRTGVVIACDIAIREFEQARLVDIPKIIYKLRRDRANAVQTREQYIFIYKVVSLYATKLTGGSLDSL